MRDVGRHVVVDDRRGRQLVEIGFGVVVFEQLVDVDDIKRAVAKCDAGRHAQSADDRLHRFLAAVVDHGVDLALVEAADEQRAVVAKGHLARLVDAAGVDADLEALRQLDLGQDAFDLGKRRRGRLSGIGGQAFLPLGLVAEEPVLRRPKPIILAVGVVVLEALRGRAAAQRQQCECADHCAGPRSG